MIISSIASLSSSESSDSSSELSSPFFLSAFSFSSSFPFSFSFSLLFFSFLVSWAASRASISSMVTPSSRAFRRSFKSSMVVRLRKGVLSPWLGGRSPPFIGKLILRFSSFLEGKRPGCSLGISCDIWPGGGITGITFVGWVGSSPTPGAGWDPSVMIPSLGTSWGPLALDPFLFFSFFAASPSGRSSTLLSCCWTWSSWAFSIPPTSSPKSTWFTMESMIFLKLLIPISAASSLRLMLINSGVSESESIVILRSFFLSSFLPYTESPP